MAGWGDMCDPALIVAAVAPPPPRNLILENDCSGTCQIVARWEEPLQAAFVTGYYMQVEDHIS